MSKTRDYTVLLITIPPVPSFPKSTQHTIYLRPHTPKIPTENDERSLFLVNVPIDSTTEHIKGVFKSLIGAGRVESVSFEHERKTTSKPNSSQIMLVGGGKNTKKRKRGNGDIDGEGEEEGEGTQLPRVWDRELRKSGSTAVVVLVDKRSVEGVMKTIRKLHKSHSQSKSKNKGGEGEDGWPIWGEGLEGKVPALGSSRYKSHHQLRYPDTKALQASVDAFMTAFNTREQEKAERDKRLRNEPDADGFVTVSRGGRVGPARREEAELKRLEMEEREKKKREQMEKAGFYRFQGREKRKEEMEGLKRRFEEDRRRVDALKKGRRGMFRPES